MQEARGSAGERLKRAAICALGISMLSALCQCPRIAECKDMLDRLPTLIKVSSQL